MGYKRIGLDMDFSSNTPPQTWRRVKQDDKFESADLWL
jgi:hypothetical protein